MAKSRCALVLDGPATANAKMEDFVGRMQRLGYAQWTIRGAVMDLRGFVRHLFDLGLIFWLLRIFYGKKLEGSPRPGLSTAAVSAICSRRSGRSLKEFRGSLR